MTTNGATMELFDSPFKAEVYFVSTRQFTDFKWGTQNPVMLRDPEFGPVRLRAFGAYSKRVTDAPRLLRELAGTDPRFGGCGASVEYAPGTGALRCPYCGYQEAVAASGREVREHSYDAFLAKPRTPSSGGHRFSCPGCGARTESDTGSGDQIAPEAVLPFALDRKGARTALPHWTFDAGTVSDPPGPQDPLVPGDRPYGAVKIALTVLVAAALAALVWLYLAHRG